MKYNPIFIKKYPGIWKSKEILRQYNALIKFIPSNKEKSYFKCTVCNRRFLTELGAYYHLDVKHEKEILETIGEKG